MASTQSLTELPSIQYTGMDYDSVISEIKTIIADNPNWQSNWTQFYSSEAGTMLIQLFAWICDNLGVRQDLLYNEMFASTATSNSSKISLLNQIGYSSSLAVAATVPIKIELDSLSSSDITIGDSANNGILSFTGKDINGSETNYEILKVNSSGKPDYLSDIVLNSSDGDNEFTEDSDGTTLTALQGKTTYEEFTSSTRDGPYFDLSATNIAYNSIRVYDYTDNMTEHNLVSSFLDMNVRSTTNTNIVPSFIIERNSKNGLRIRYPSESIMTYDSEVLDEVTTSDGTKHRMYVAGNTIRVYYRTTAGSEGNIPVGFINTSINLTNEDKETITATVYNNAAGSGGKDAETLSEAIKNAPMSIRTLNRAVTSEDYDNILGNSSLILKSKSYSPNNMPDGFEDYYGRKINPQEVFSFVLMNKNYSDLSGSNYNYFPWLDSNKLHILNEEYAFGESEMNYSASTSGDTYTSVYLVNDSSEKKWYRNETIIPTSTGIKEAVQDESTKSAVKIKLHKFSTSETYIDNIQQQLLSKYVYDDDIESTTEDLDSNLTVANNEITNEVNAICISDCDDEFTPGDTDSSGNYVPYDTTSQELLAEPIDCTSFETIKFTMDNGLTAEIDLTQEKSSSTTYTNYYLLADNPSPSDYSELTFDPSSKEYAIKRYGIVQLINSQMLSLFQGGETQYRLYDGKHSYQYLDLNKESRTAETLTQEGYYVIKFGENTYAFNITSNIYNSAINYFRTRVITKEGSETVDPTVYFVKSMDSKAYIDSTNIYYSKETDGSFTQVNVTAGDDVSGYYQTVSRDDTTTTNWGSLNGISDILNYEMYGLSDEDNVKKLTENSGIYTWENVTDFSELEKFKVETVTRILYSSDYDGDEESSVDNNTYDLLISSVTPVTSSEDNYFVVEEAEDPKSTYYNFIDKITSSEGLQSDPALLINYNSVASSGYVDGTYRLVIQSPRTGKESTLFFTRTTSEDSTDFMNYMGVTYNSKGRSEKSYGIKLIELYLYNCVTGYTGADTTGTILDELPSYGDIIFQDNDINHVFKNGTVYMSFKLNDNSYIEIDKDHYQNFYYSSDDEANEAAKPDIIGIEGESIYSVTKDKKTTYYIDANKSDFDVRITSETQDTNSLYSITDCDGLDVIPVGKTRIVTTEITADSSISGECPFVFSVDKGNTTGSFSKDTCFYLDPGDLATMTGSSLFSKINEYLTEYSESDSVYEDLRVTPYNVSSLVRQTYNHNNQLLFSGLLKTDDGCLRFFYPTNAVYEALGMEYVDVEETVLKFYKKIFGTNLTNSDLYTTYPTEAMITINDNSESFIIDNTRDSSLEDGEYYYAPNSLQKSLKFVYRKLYTNSSGEKDSKFGDYYIDFEGDSFTRDSSSNPGYTFKICKSSYGNFPDIKFYVHYVNDRTYDSKRTSSEDELLTDEDSLQDYLSEKKIAGTEVTFLKPYFRTFDIAATIQYNSNYSLSTVKAAVEEAVDAEFGLENISNIDIANTVSKSKIYKTIMGISGVETVDITYFGYDYTDQTTYPNNSYEIDTDFYEIATLYSPDESSTHGKIFTYVKYGSEAYTAS